MKIRIDRFLSHMGIGSRSEIKNFLKISKILVNGKVINDSKIKVDTQVDEVFFDDKKIIYHEFTYLMLNKPKGYISATFDEKLKTVVDLLEKPYSNMNLFPVGRLDIDTTGLLILTNDGKFSYNVTNPKKKINKKYFVKLLYPFTDEQKNLIEKGIFLKKENILIENAVVEKVSEKEIFLTISQGKFHQVKRMLEYVQNKVVDLKRVKIGFLELDKNLKLSEYRELSEEEILKIFHRAY